MINHKHKYIYTKVAKAGSTSIQKMLKKTSDEKDLAHLGHWHLADDIDEDTKDYFKFTFVRNPWDRAVSYYHYKRKKERQKNKISYFTKFTFEQFLLEPHRFIKEYNWAKNSPHLEKLIKEVHWYDNQIDWLVNDKGVPLVDYVGKLENLDKEFPIICDRLGIPNVKIMHKNKSNHDVYTKYYTSNEMIEAVEKLWGKDVKLYNYKYGE